MDQQTVREVLAGALTKVIGALQKLLAAKSVLEILLAAGSVLEVLLVLAGSTRMIAALMIRWLTFNCGQRKSWLYNLRMCLVSY